MTEEVSSLKNGVSRQEMYLSEFKFFRWQVFRNDNQTESL